MPPFFNKKKFTPSLAVPLLLSAAVLYAPQTFAAPTANADNYTTTTGQSITVSPLSNDRADSGTTVYVEVVNSPSPYGTGSTTLNNNSVTYTPPANFTGSTTFWYGIKDSTGLTTSAPITVTVTDSGSGVPTSTPPPQAYGNAATTTSGQSITIDAIGNDTGDGLFITEVDNPANGTATITDNKVRYTAPASFVGVSTFWYQIQDSEGRKTSNAITVTVNESSETSAYPTAGNDTAETTRGNPITIAPMWNDTGSVIRITGVDGTTTQGSTVEITEDNTKVLYTPSIWSEAGDTFWYVITDKFGRKNAAKIVVAVTGADSGSYPTAGSDNYTVNKNSTGTVFNVFSNDTGSGLSFNQLYAWTQKGGRTYDNDGSVKYDAPSGFVGTDEFWYSMKDSQGRTNSAKVTITVEETDTGGVNEAPDAVEDILQSEINASEFEIDVLANDTDPNGDTLSVQSVEDARSGSVRLVNGRVLYTPPSSPTSDTFRYTVSDGRGGTGSAAATIGVRDPNNPTSNPTISNEFITVSPGETVFIDVLANDFDPDGDTLILDQVTSGSQGSTSKVLDTNVNRLVVEYTALDSASGTDQFYYGVADGLGGNGSGNVNITFR